MFLDQALHDGEKKAKKSRKLRSIYKEINRKQGIKTTSSFFHPLKFVQNWQQNGKNQQKTHTQKKQKANRN
jgi:hypothetical protein